MRRTRTTRTTRPFALAALIAAIMLCTFGANPWWVLLAMFVGSFELRVTR